jgi:hypothetical protein
MLERHTDQMSAWIGPPDQRYIKKISWAGAGAQTVGENAYRNIVFCVFLRWNENI